jgi:hypothetical protein
MGIKIIKIKESYLRIMKKMKNELTPSENNENYENK